MITKSEWQTINEDLMSEERRRFGEPPTFEEVLKYLHGELSGAEEESVRERLACYPDLVRTITASFPDEAAQPGDDDFVTDAEFARHWSKIQTKMHRRVSQFWPIFGAIAATVAVVLGALLVRTQTELRNERMQPRVAWDQQILLPDGQRGGGETAATLTAKGKSFLLVVPIVAPSFDDYRLDIVGAQDPDHALWRSPILQRGDNEAFEILVPRAFLKPGKYAVLLIGVNGARQEQVASYSIRVP